MSCRSSCFAKVETNDKEKRFATPPPPSPSRSRSAHSLRWPAIQKSILGNRSAFSAHPFLPPYLPACRPALLTLFSKRVPLSTVAPQSSPPGTNAGHWNCLMRLPDLACSRHSSQNSWPHLFKALTRLRFIPRPFRQVRPRRGVGREEDGVVGKRR